MINVGVHTTDVHVYITFCVEHVCMWAWRHIPISIAHVFFSCFSLLSRERRATACVSVCLSDLVCLREGLSECACCMLSSALIHCMRTLLVWLRVWASISFPFASLASPPHSLSTRTSRCGWHLILRFPPPPVVPASPDLFFLLVRAFLYACYAMHSPLPHFPLHTQAPCTMRAGAG